MIKGAIKMGEKAAHHWGWKKILCLILVVAHRIISRGINQLLALGYLPDKTTSSHTLVYVIMYLLSIWGYRRWPSECQLSEWWSMPTKEIYKLIKGMMDCIGRYIARWLKIYNDINSIGIKNVIFSTKSIRVE